MSFMRADFGMGRPWLCKNSLVKRQFGSLDDRYGHGHGDSLLVHLAGSALGMFRVGSCRDGFGSELFVEGTRGGTRGSLKDAGQRTGQERERGAARGGLWGRIRGDGGRSLAVAKHCEIGKELFLLVLEEAPNVR